MDTNPCDELVVEELYLSCLIPECDNRANGLKVSYTIGVKTYTSWVCSYHARMVTGSLKSYSIGPFTTKR